MIQIVIVLLYMILTIGIGIWTKKYAVSSGTFEGAELGMLLCVVAGAGEWIGGTATTGVAEYGYEYGLSGAWYTIANGIGICFLAVFFAKLFRDLALPTVSGIIGKFLGRDAKMASAALLIFVMLAIGSSQMVAMGTLGERLFHISSTVAILSLGFGVLLYTVIGGMLAVGYTNILHMVVIYIGSLIAVVLCLWDIGGMGVLVRKLPETYFSMDSIGMTKISSWLVASVLGACVAQAGIQPILASKDSRTAVRSSYLIALIVTPFGMLSALLGMMARVRFPALENAKLALPTLLISMHPVVGGFIMASMIAAILSTAAPIFLACGTLFTNDIYRVKKERAGQPPNDGQLLKISRITTFVAGLLCILLALLFYDSQRLLDIVYFAYSVRGSLFIILLLGIYWKKTSGRAAVFAMLATGVVGLFWIMYKNMRGCYPICPQFSETYASIITALVVTVSGSLFVGIARNE